MVLLDILCRLYMYYLYRLLSNFPLSLYLLKNNKVIYFRQDLPGKALWLVVPSVC
jgi:hypothetical protein